MSGANQQLESDPQPEPRNVQGRRLTFGDSVDRLVVYLLASLTAFLCITSLDNRDKLTALLAEKKGDTELRAQMMTRLEKLSSDQKILAQQNEAMRIEAAHHGWNTTVTQRIGD
jgi:hypothetical protein